jgi:hypothetical protein
MAKNAVYDYSTTAASNTDIDALDATGATGLVKSGDNYTRSLMSHLKAKANDDGAVNTVGGTGDAITVTLASNPTALVDGMRFSINAPGTNTGAVTIAVTNSGATSLGTKKVRKWSGGAETALSAGDITSGHIINLVYDSARDTAAGAFMIDGSASVAAATTSAAGIVELATTTEAFQASSSTLAVTPAGLANLYSTALGLAIEVADLKGSRLNMAGGIADAYDSETDVDTATSTNESYDSALDLYSPTSPASTEQSATVDNQTNTLGFTYIEMGWAINNSVTLTQFRIYSLTAFSGTARVLERTSASNFTSRANSAFSHTGSGWEEFAVSYAVPGSGDFYVGLYSAGTPSGQRSAAENRAFVSGDISTSTSGATEAGSGLRPTVGVRWSVTPDNMTLVSNAFTATAVPTVARVACFIDPQVTITINTDFTAEASRDGGTTWTAATLALVSNPVGTVEQYEGTVSISSQPSGTSMKYRLKTLNNKDIDVTGVVFQWS